MGHGGPVLFIRHGARYMEAHICREQLTSPLRSKYSEMQDKQVKTVNSQSNTENNIVNKIELFNNEEVDNKTDPQKCNTPISKRKTHPYPTVVVKPNQIIKFKDSNDTECIERVISHPGKATGKHKSCCNIEYQSPLTLNGTKINVNSVYDVEVIKSQLKIMNPIKQVMKARP